MIAAKARARPALRIAAHVGAIAGLLSGVMWMAGLIIETFAGLSGWPNVAATGPLLLGGSAVWGAAGAAASRRSGSHAAGALAAVCGAMVCVAVTVALGWTLDHLAVSTLEHMINGSPEYLASHWGDLHAFAIANSLDAAFTHLLLAPIIATLTGTLGALIATRSRGRARTAGAQPSYALPDGAAGETMSVLGFETVGTPRYARPMKRILVMVGGIYLALAARGHARERSGAVACHCRPDCWCKRPGLNAFRWVLPFGHNLGCQADGRATRAAAGVARCLT